MPPVGGVTSRRPGWPADPSAMRDLIRDMLRARAHVYLPIHGESMSPTLRSGDVVKVERVRTRDIRVGDVLVLWEGEALVVHRVIRRGRDEVGFYVIALGDNATCHGPRVYGDAILGRVAGVGSHSRETRSPIAARALFAGFAVLAGFWIWFWTQGLPFYLEDYAWLRSPESVGDLFASLAWPATRTIDHLCQNRPLAVLLYRALWGMFGDSPVAFHLAKSFVFVGVLLAFYSLVRTLSVRRGIAYVATGLLAVLTPVVVSTLWVCDIEVLAQLLVLGVALLAMPGSPSQSVSSRTMGRDLLRSSATFALGLLALNTKETGMIVLAIIGAAALVNSRDMRWSWIAVVAALATFGAIRGVCSLEYYPRASYSQFPSLRCFRLNLAGFRYLFGLPLLAVTVGLVGLAAAGLLKGSRDLPGRLLAKRRAELQAAMCLGAWLASTVAAWFFTPAETRLLVPSAVVFVLVLSYCTALALRAGRPRHASFVLVALLFAVAFTGARNLQYLLHYRGSWGSQFIAAARTAEWIDSHYAGAVVTHDSYLPMLASAKGLNEYVWGSEAGNGGTGRRLHVSMRPISRWLTGKREVPAEASCSSNAKDVTTVARLDGVASSFYDVLVQHMGVRIRFVDPDSMAIFSEEAYPADYVVSQLR